MVKGAVFMRKAIWIIVASFLFIGLIAAQDLTQDQSAAVIKHVPIKDVSPASGKEMYASYCAACHGVAGKGDGPAASALKVLPADLATLASRNDGKFPAFKVSTAIRGDSSVAAHGSKEMPVWGSLFQDLSHGHETEVQQRVSNLTKYIESLQTK
jgi:mono/diheme cytochrome c family protein